MTVCQSLSSSLMYLIQDFFRLKFQPNNYASFTWSINQPYIQRKYGFGRIPISADLSFVCQMRVPDTWYDKFAYKSFDYKFNIIEKLYEFKWHCSEQRGVMQGGEQCLADSWTVHSRDVYFSVICSIVHWTNLQSWLINWVQVTDDCRNVQKMALNLTLSWGSTVAKSFVRQSKFSV